MPLKLPFIVINIVCYYLDVEYAIQYIVLFIKGEYMKKFITLVTVDFSKSSSIVLEKAIDFTRELGGEVHVVHIVEESFFSSNHSFDSMKASGFAKLKEEFSSIKDDNYHCVSGKIKVEVANVAKTINADVVIIGSSGETHFLSDLIMGSHTKEIIKYSSVPVLVVKNSHELKYKDILILTDLSDESKSAIEKVVPIFPESNIKLINLYYLPIDGRINTYGFNAKDVLEYQKSVESNSKNRADSFLDSLDLPNDAKVSILALKSSLNPKLFKQEVGEINFDLLILHATQNISFFAFDIIENSDVDLFIVK